jgi:hypothetical protein
MNKLGSHVQVAPLSADVVFSTMSDTMSKLSVDSSHSIGAIIYDISKMLFESIHTYYETTIIMELRLQLLIN